MLPRRLDGSLGVQITCSGPKFNYVCDVLWIQFLSNGVYDPRWFTGGVSNEWSYYRRRSFDEER